MRALSKRNLIIIAIVGGVGGGVSGYLIPVKWFWLVWIGWCLLWCYLASSHFPIIIDSANGTNSQPTGDAEKSANT